MAQPQRVKSGLPGILFVAILVAVLSVATFGYLAHSHGTNTGGSVATSNAPSIASGLKTAGTEEIRDYAVTLAIAPDGALRVTEHIVYDFGYSQRHGIYRYIPDEYPYVDPQHPASKIKYNRVYKITNVTVRSTAPAKTAKAQANHALQLKIGDPNSTVSGVQTYEISYLVRGALNGYSDHVELDWNAIGTEWIVPIQSATVSVSGPSVKALACFAGPRGSNQPCDSNAHATTWSTQGLRSYEGMTVAVTMPPSAVTGTAPILKEVFTLNRAFSRTPLTIAGSLIILILGMGLLIRRLSRSGRDQRYVGLTPGLMPPGSEQSTTELAPRGGTDYAVAFSPPAGLSPGQIGTLIDERADTSDVTASVIDLAVRGYLRIEEIAPGHVFGKKDWKLTMLKRSDEPDTRNVALKTYEAELHDALFNNGSRAEVTISELKTTFAGSLTKVRNQLYDDVVAQGWFARRPDRVRSTSGVMGALIAALGIVATILLAKSTHAALLGLPIIFIGIAAAATSSHMPSRTAKGSAVLAQSLGFKSYLLTAEADQIKFEERADIFSRYLPYAMVFGVAERWTKALGDAVTAVAPSAGGVGGSAIGILPWYIGPPGWSFNDLGSSMNSFTSIAGSTFVSTPASSGGGFGGGGGFSGGGGGGGGGGSW